MLSVGFSAGSGSQYFCWLVTSIDLATANRYLMNANNALVLGVGSSAGSWSYAATGTGGLNNYGSASEYTTPYIIEFVLDSGTGFGRVFINGIAIGLERTYGATAIGGTTGLFSNHLGNAFFMEAEVSEIFHLDSIPTADQRINLLNGLAQQYNVNDGSIAPPPGTTASLISFGDSLVAGVGDPFTMWTIKAAASKGIWARNLAIGGSRASEWEVTIPYKLGYFPFPSSMTTVNIVALMGTNDMGAGGDTAAVAAANIEDTWLLVNSSYNRIACTIPARGDSQPTQDKIDDANITIRVDYTNYADELIDIAANPNYDESSDASNQTLYKLDLLHHTEMTQDIFADLLTPLI
jgi:hypothetical protein